MVAKGLCGSGDGSCCFLEILEAEEKLAGDKGSYPRARTSEQRAEPSLPSPFTSLSLTCPADTTPQLPKWDEALTAPLSRTLGPDSDTKFRDNLKEVS